MRIEAGDGDHPTSRAACEVRQRGAHELMKRGGDYRKRALQPLAWQISKAAAVRKARCMHDRIDGAKAFARGTDKLGGRSRRRVGAAAPFYFRSGARPFVRFLPHA